MSTIREPRCTGTFRGAPCRRKLAELVTSPAVIVCGRCGTVCRF